MLLIGLSLIRSKKINIALLSLTVLAMKKHVNKELHMTKKNDKNLKALKNVGFVIIRLSKVILK